MAFLFLVLALALVGLLGYFWVGEKEDELMAGICELEDNSRISEMSGDLLFFNEPLLLSELEQRINFHRPPIIGHGDSFLCFERSENLKTRPSIGSRLQLEVTALTRLNGTVLFKSEGWSEKLLGPNSGNAPETLDCLRIKPDRNLPVGEEIRELEITSSDRFSAAKMIWYSEGYYPANCG